MKKLVSVCVAIAGLFTASMAMADDAATLSVPQKQVAEICPSKPAVVLLMSPMCRACRNMELLLDRIQKEHPDFCIFLVSNQGTPAEQLAASLDKYDIDLSGLIDNDGLWAKIAKTTDIPYLFLFDKHAGVIKRYAANEMPTHDELVTSLMLADEKK